MRLLLDTNACIAILKGNAPELRQKLALEPVDHVVTCSVVRAELMYGAAKSQAPEKTRLQAEALLHDMACLPFDEAAADLYGVIRAHLDRAGTPIGPNDLLIAAIVLAAGAKLVTRNVREFERVPGLAIESW
jgi:tRNA(fMet)-specific endonuclease VapC